VNTRQEFRDLFDQSVERLETNLQISTDDLAAIAAEESDRLARILENNEPGFEQALIAARDNVALRAGLAVGAFASGLDREWLGLIAGALRFAAGAAAGS